MMIDTNIVIDLREEASPFFDWSLTRVAESVTTTSVVVVGELAYRTGTLAEITDMLAGYDVLPMPLTIEASFRAGVAQRAYRAAGGTREKLLGDFLIGAHAVTAGQPLLTRDPRRYRTYFPDLTLITPESHP